MGMISYIKEELNVIKERDPAIKTGMEVLLYSSFKAILSYRVAQTLFSCEMGFAACCQKDRDRDSSGGDHRKRALYRSRKWCDHRRDDGDR